MRTFETESYYDKGSGEWLEFYTIDNKTVSEEEYFEALENEEFNEEEDCDCCEDCDGCNGCDDIDDLSDSLKLEQEEIAEAIVKVLDENACINCKINEVYNLAYRFKEIGKTEARLEIKDFLDFVEN